MKIDKLIVVNYFFVLLIACTNRPVNYKLPDMYRLPMTDTTILGTWKVREDTDKHNFIIFQSTRDYYSMFLDSTHKIYTAAEVAEQLQHYKHDTEEAIERLQYLNDTARQTRDYKKACDIYKQIRDTDNVAEDLQHFHFNFYISIVNGQTVFNIRKRFFSGSSIVLKKPVTSNGDYNDLYHLRVLYRSPAGDTMVTALVGDSTLLHVTDSVAFCKKIKDNFNNPGFYSDTLHFYRINTYHSDGDSAFMKADTAWHMNPNKIFRGLVRRNYK